MYTSTYNFIPSTASYGKPAKPAMFGKVVSISITPTSV